MRARRLALPAAGAVLYILAAWWVAPGFYDGTCPPVANYAWLVPPAGAKPSAKAPGSVHAVIKNDKGPFFAATTDDNPQVQMSWVPNAWDVPAGNSITLDIKPVNECPAPADLRFTTNVYSATASAPLAAGKEAVIKMLMPADLPSATNVYFAGSDCQWKPLPNAQLDLCGGITVRISTLGHFAAGISTSPAASGAARAPTVGGSWLPIVVAGAIVVVVLAGVPLAMAGRRKPAVRGGGRANPGAGPPSRRGPRRPARPKDPDGDAASPPQDRPPGT